MIIRLDNLPRSKKINCIKAARWAFKGEDGFAMGLKEAKDAVEAAMTQQPKGDTFSMQGEARSPIESIKEYVCRIQGHSGMNGCGLPEVKIREVPTLDPKDIETNGAQVFNVPNDEAGRAFMADVAKYLNRPRYKPVKRGRGSEGRERRNGRMTYNGQSNCPIDKADWIALYIEGKTRHDPSNQLASLVSENQRLGNQLVTAKALADSAEQDIATLKAELKDANEAQANAERLASQLNSQLDLAVDRAETYREELENKRQELDDKVAVSQVKTSLPPMTLPLADGSKVNVTGATKIEAV